MARANTNRIL